MLLLNVYYRCKSGQREAFHQALSALGARAVSIQEAGNGKYDYFFDAQDPDVLLLVEHWESQAHLDAHCSTETFAKLQALKAEYCENVAVNKFEV